MLDIDNIFEKMYYQQNETHFHFLLDPDLLQKKLENLFVSFGRLLFGLPLSTPVARVASGVL